MSDVDVYYGVASGQQRSALRRLDPERCMISHATQQNTPWEGPEWFVDSGGYHHMKAGTGEYETSAAEYVSYLQTHDPERWAMRDYPCEPELLSALNRTVSDQQRRTVDGHRALIDADAPGQPVTVVQGWTVAEYLAHLDELRDAGLVTGVIGVGSVCRRGADRTIAEVLRAVSDASRPSERLHAFGVKGSILRFEEVCDAVDSVDSAAYDVAESRVPSVRGSESFTWRDSARAYLNWRHRLEQKMGTESLHDPRQATFGDGEVTVRE